MCRFIKSLNSHFQRLCPFVVSVAVAGVAVVMYSLPLSKADEATVDNDGKVSPGLEISKDQAEFFRDKVLPLLESRCFECHGDTDDVEAELRMTTRKGLLTGGESGPAIEPGDPDRSLLIQAIRYENFEMPPRNKLPDEEIDIFVKWVQDGAPWPEEMESKVAASEKAKFPLEERIASHWAWKKIVRPEVPVISATDWPANDTDRFLLAKMEEVGISPAQDAERRAILRRLYFDLIGLPPTIEQQSHFFDDPAETSVAMEKVVDELLASPQFGERWARHWLDLMRYAETLGHEFDYPLPHAWQYRDYVIRALNADVPYDQFVREHIAGDLMEIPRKNPEFGFNESIIATGFWYLCEDKHAPVDVKAEEASRIDNQIDVFGKTFLGLTIACARCHDHKFDAITAEDYYALSGFLQSSRRRIEWIDSHDETQSLTDSLIAARSQAAEILRGALSDFSADQTEGIILQAMASSRAEGSPQNPAVEVLRTVLHDEKSLALSHPLSLLATLAQSKPDAADADRIRQWSATRDDLKAKASSDLSSNGWVDTRIGSSTVVAADLRRGMPTGWRAFGAAFSEINQTSGNLNTERLTISWTSAGILPDSGSAVSSGTLSPRLRGQLHSPEFVLTHPEIQIRAAGKASRVRLVIDGYVMNEFSELLFGGCRQPIDTDGEFRWIRIAGDVRRYIGHRCHLEFLDEGDGWFAVREVRLMGRSDEGPVNDPDICRVNTILSVSADQSREQLVHDVVAGLSDDPTWAALVLQVKLLKPEQLSSYDQILNQWQKLAERPQPGAPVLVMCDGSGEDEYIFIRGNHNNHGPTAVRHMLTALDGGQPLRNAADSGRMELVDRLFADSNPFPARVMVNRVWQHLFGRGIVASSDNFGVLGEPPSHPELLDFLADDFRKDGWSLKRLIRRLVMSRTYRLSSQRIESAEQQDPTNRLLHRFSIRRLEAEALRDAILFVSGRLDSAMFGAPVPVHLSGFMQGRGRPGESGPIDGAGRRSIYQGVRRNFLNPFMLAFDTPQPATAIARRNKSNVPAQALMLMNNEFVHQQADVWAARLVKEVPNGGDELVRHAFRQAFCRVPSELELDAFREFAQSVATEKNVPTEKALSDTGILSQVCHVLLNQKEFLFLE